MEIGILIIITAVIFFFLGRYSATGKVKDEIIQQVVEDVGKVKDQIEEDTAEIGAVAHLEKDDWEEQFGDKAEEVKEWDKIKGLFLKPFKKQK